jgi:solute:Na+ symporter, SSS family
VFGRLETRFGLAARLYCSACYCLLQLARTCSVLYLVSFPIAELTSWSHEAVTMILGFLIACYTTFGGFAAVVFTDVVQSLTLLVGGALTIAYSVAEAGGLARVWSLAAEAGKLSLSTDASGSGRSPPLLWLFGTTLYVRRVPHAQTRATCTRMSGLTSLLWTRLVNFAV